MVTLRSLHFFYHSPGQIVFVNRCLQTPLDPPVALPQGKAGYLDAGAPPAGFRTAWSYSLFSSRTQNHSAISQPGSSLWSLGGLTQGLVYTLGSSMMICYLLYFSFFQLRLFYLLGAVEPPPEGFLTSLSYVCNSLDAQNHSAISHLGSSLWSFGGLTQTFVYDLGSSMMICCSSVS